MAMIRYAALQVPGFLIAVILLNYARDQGWISGFTVILILAVLVAKDVVLYPFFKKALQPGPTDMVTRLHGKRGKVVNPLDPEGQVNINGVIWNAKSIDGMMVEAGSRVLVSGHKGLTLYVHRCNDNC
ncbi:NfeD family protein [Desulfonatronospira sp.]|uniref:NfeD family protein n=1 Tax=Desulfonatronospira sp. TaxID=1962951 RepID=UPI0025B9D0E1|nr:NfeD family protein [Desulfonatronospira sp.]